MVPYRVAACTGHSRVGSMPRDFQQTLAWDTIHGYGVPLVLLTAAEIPHRNLLTLVFGRLASRRQQSRDATKRGNKKDPHGHACSRPSTWCTARRHHDDDSRIRHRFTKSPDGLEQRTPLRVSSTVSLLVQWNLNNRLGQEDSRTAEAPFWRRAKYL